MVSIYEALSLTFEKLCRYGVGSLTSIAVTKILNKMS